MFELSLVSIVLIVIAVFYFRNTIRNIADGTEIVTENATYIVAKSSDVGVRLLQDYARDQGMEIDEEEDSLSYFHDRRLERARKIKELKDKAKGNREPQE